MSYGSSTYSGSAYGGNANSVNEQVFFQLDIRVPDVLFEAEAAFMGEDSLYSVYTLQESESGSGPAGVEYKIYTAHEQGETPQLQVTVQGNGQSVIAAAPRIVVTAIIDSAVWAVGQAFRVTGRPGG